MESHSIPDQITERSEASERLTVGLRRAFDVTLSLLLIVIVAPLMLVVAVLIRLENPGPALFRQQRVGRNRRLFTVYKFRSMRANANCEPHRAYVRALIHGTGLEELKQGDGDKSLFKLAVDDRVTRVGRVIRRLSIDELPQLFNVVRGEMSLVGPRPVIAYEVDQYPDWYHERFAVKPGLTGLWQVSGRSDLTWEESVRLDLRYVENWSLGLDLAILLRTWGAVFRGRGAY
jgi:exopolysaccharide biosynthesis polyprenyl glycosylphosphotransferase